MHFATQSYAPHPAGGDVNVNPVTRPGPQPGAANRGTRSTPDRLEAVLSSPWFVAAASLLAMALLVAFGQVVSQGARQGPLRAQSMAQRSTAMPSQDAAGLVPSTQPDRDGLSSTDPEPTP